MITAGRLFYWEKEMPYHVTKSNECPSDKPWAVIKDSDGEIMGCHMTEDDAMDQMKAIHANESNQASTEIERRFFHVAELRAKSDNGFGIKGHAAVFNQLSDVIWDFREKIAPGAFAESIEKDDIRSLWNHDPSLVLGRTKSKTLRLKEDNIGLHIDNDFPDTTYARDYFKLIERGDVDQMSFGFRVLPGGEDWTFENNMAIRTIKKAQLFDVSPVTFPAYPQTSVSVRTLATETRRKFESLENSNKDDKAAFALHLKARREFLQSRTRPENPLSLSAIIKNARVKSI